MPQTGLVQSRRPVVVCHRYCNPSVGSFVTVKHGVSNNSTLGDRTLQVRRRWHITLYKNPTLDSNDDVRFVPHEINIISASEFDCASKDRNH